MLDLFAQGRIASNLIEITPELGELFAAYWSKVMPPERRGNLALPFFHLRSSGFWHLLPQPGMEAALKTIRQVDTLSQLGKLVLGASLDDGRTAVAAAHIVPWSISHDDDPHNGLALCCLCHWTFDQGLLGVSAKYLLLSRELRIAQNVPGHLLTLEGRPIIGPDRAIAMTA